MSHAHGMVFKSKGLDEIFLEIINNREKYPFLNDIIDGKIAMKDLTHKTRKNSIITTIRINENLKYTINEAIRLLKSLGATNIKSVNDLINFLLISFVDSIISNKIQVNEKEVKITTQIMLAQINNNAIAPTAVGKSKLKHTLSQQDAQVLKSVVMTLKRLNNKPLPSEQRIRILEEQLEKLLRLDQFNPVVQHYVQLIRGELDGLKAFLEGDE
ncbi:MAG: hypothetical protein Q6363_010030 [Candidatus Njordarchaeota archaeon]